MQGRAGFVVVYQSPHCRREFALTRSSGGSAVPILRRRPFQASGQDLWIIAR